MKTKSGFTIIELLVVVSIMLMFLGLTLAQFNSYNDTLKIKNQAQKLVDVIELAKKKAVSSDLYDNTCTNFSGYQLNLLSSSSYSLNFCCNSDCSTKLQTYSLNTDITNQNISILPSSGTISFPPLMANFKNTITTIYVKNTVANKCAKISISTIGIIDLIDSASCP